MATRRAVLKGLGLSTVFTGAACVHFSLLNIAEQGSGVSQAQTSRKPIMPTEAWASKLIDAAESQVGKTVRYDGRYVGLKYPMGDVPQSYGVCTDVVIRAYRQAFDMDLQKLVHEDMKHSFSSYPDNWGLKRPDKNIDHRRVPNLERFFMRRNAALPVTKNAADYHPGDLVSYRLSPGNLPHIVIVSDRPGRDGKGPAIIHNIGAGTQVEDRLFDFKITGHFRFPPKQV